MFFIIEAGINKNLKSFGYLLDMKYKRTIFDIKIKE